ncbi:MAG: hypothetical protein HZB57_03095 [Gammaproteobacteria bacterium]|nr:hypothetical protein [Gammaproteobacteria bacterium]
MPHRHTLTVALGKGDLNSAANTAEQQLGRASMGRRGGTGMMGMGTGEFMSNDRLYAARRHI